MKFSATTVLATVIFAAPSLSCAEMTINYDENALNIPCGGSLDLYMKARVSRGYVYSMSARLENFEGPPFDMNEVEDREVSSDNALIVRWQPPPLPEAWGPLSLHVIFMAEYDHYEGYIPVINGCDGPNARCVDVTVKASSDDCSAAYAQIDRGSYSNEDTSLTISQFPSAPYSVGDTTVTLTATDKWGQTATCSATVTVEPPEVEVSIEDLDAVIVYVEGSSVAPLTNGLLSVVVSSGSNFDTFWTTTCDVGEGNEATLENTDSASPKLIVSGPPRVCDVTVLICDSCERCVTSTGVVTVVDPSAGFVTGGGWIESPAGAYFPDQLLEGKASFGFVSKYKKGQSTPDGNTNFKFKTAGLDFQSTSYEWLVVTGSDCAKFKGLGIIKGDSEEYGFMLTACDSISQPAEEDTFRIKIWKTSDSMVTYDNMPVGDDNEYDGTPISGGKIQIHQIMGNRRVLRN